jgi:hypothetical protein
LRHNGLVIDNNGRLCRISRSAGGVLEQVTILHKNREQV